MSDSEELERMRTTLDSIGDGVICTDIESNVTYLNAVAESLTGWTSSDALGVPLTQVFHIVNETTRQIVENPAIRALREGVIVGLANHTILIARDGTERPIDDSASPIRQRAGQTKGCVLVFRDISDRKKAENALRASESFNRSLMDSTVDCVKVLSLDGDVLQMNAPGMCAMEIDDFAPFCGREWRSLWPPASAENIESSVRSAKAGGTRSFQAFCPTAKGTPRWWDVTVSPIRDANGDVSQLLAVSRDITERVRAGDEAQRVLDSISDGVITIDRDWRITYVNPKAEEVIRPLGLSAKSAIGAVFWEAIPELKGGVFETNYRRAFEDRVTVAFESFYPPLDIWIDVRAYPKSDGLSLYFQDVTERKQMENSLRQLAANLSESDRRKDEFLATLAHELRNPLAPIRNGLQLIHLAGDQPEVVSQAREMMDRQLTQLVRLVDDLMDVSRINQGKLELRRERLDVSTAVASAIETSRTLIDDMGHQLTVDLPPEPIYVNGDLTRLAQVFMNLLNNAAKYSERGGEIGIAVESRGGDILIRVKDNGIGIAADQLPHIFELFSQVENSLDRAQGGLGIGLSLVQRLVQMHGGSVEALSEGPGRGSEFVVRLPVMTGLAMQASADDGDVVEKRGGLRILIVDDNRDGADTLATVLRAMGNETHTAYDGEESVAKAAELRPDVILLDIGLPKLNGYEACARIRTQPGGAEILVIAQTGWGQDKDRLRTKAAGFDHHLVKPVEPARLMALLGGRARAIE